MIFLYHLIATLLFAAALPFLPLVWLFSKKRRANLVQRLGLATGFSKKGRGEFRIWVHALSVGEVNSALPFLEALRKRRPAASIIFTASTLTGYRTACRITARKEGNLVQEIGYFPFDLWFSLSRVLGRIDPDLVCLIETDLWPGFLARARQLGIPVALVNARLSENALKGYLRSGPLRSLIFDNLSLVLAQTGLDLRRFQGVGVPGDRVALAGNIKFDHPVPVWDEAGIKALEDHFGLAPARPVWVAGSTHEGEEAMVLQVWSELKSRKILPKLIVAPRDPARSAKLLNTLDSGYARAALLSDPVEKKQAADILFIDTLGELVKAYRISDLALVGGSLVPQGGHNPLEPAMFGKPVLFGTHMADFLEVAGMLLEGGGAREIQDGEALLEHVAELFLDSGLRRSMGEAAQRVFAANSGAVARSLDILEDHGYI